MNLSAKLRKLAGWEMFPLLLALSATHSLNDFLQSVISAMYPILKDTLDLTFIQIGIITFVYQISASVFQPVVGYAFDKRPFAYSLPLGMASTAVGIVLFSFVTSFTGILISVFLIGLGSATTHPEASRLTSLIGRERRGLAQSIFQVGGNLGTSFGPLMVALIVAPHDRKYVLWFLIASAAAFAVMRPICSWFKNYLITLKESGGKKNIAADMPLPLSKGRTSFVIFIIMLLIISKYLYMAAITNYYTFFLIEKFGVSISASQVYLFIFVVSTAIGTLCGGPVGDRYGRKLVIWISILGTAPFSLFLPYASLPVTAILSFCSGFMLSSAFPAILVYSQELIPHKLGMISGLFFGFAFGVGGIMAAALGYFIDIYGIMPVYQVAAFAPLLGIVAVFLPNLRKIKEQAA